jgi:hypothetical protein
MLFFTGHFEFGTAERNKGRAGIWREKAEMR